MNNPLRKETYSNAQSTLYWNSYRISIPIDDSRIESRKSIAEPKRTSRACLDTVA